MVKEIRRIVLLFIFPVLFLHTALGQITGLQPGSYTETSLPGGIFDVNDDGDTSDGVY